MSSAAGEDRARGEASPSRLPHLNGLDGIRGLSALAVLVFHAGALWLPAGFLGVDVFFVVSGFLITALLVAESEQMGGVALAQFWLRRARRLLPALFMILIATTVYAAIALPGELVAHGREALAAVVYVTNWDLIAREISYFETFSRPSQLRHLWSLAVEEQFYLVWPLLFTGVLRLCGMRWLRAAGLGLVLGLGTASAIWMGVLYESGDNPSRVYFGSDARAFTILAGVALGLVWRPWRWGAGMSRWRRWALDAVGGAGFAVLVLLMVWGSEWDAWMYPWGLLAMSAAATGLVAAAARPGSLISSALGGGVMRWLGQRSYSIYLWHWPVLLALQWEVGLQGGGVGLMLAGLVVTLVLSEIGYRAVEVPMRRPEFWAALRRRVEHAVVVLWQLRPPRHAVAAVLIGSIAVAAALGLFVLPSERSGGIPFAALGDQSDAETAGQAAVDRSGADQTSNHHDDSDTPLVVTATATNSNLAEPNRVAVPDSREQSPPRFPTAHRSRQQAPAGSNQPPSDSAVAATGDVAPIGESAAAALVDDSDSGPGEWFTYYRIVEGDTPYSLWERFRVSADDLQALNSAEVLARFWIGDVLKIRCPGGPCGLVDLQPEGGCVRWESALGSGRACGRVQMMVEAPAAFAVESRSLDWAPSWTWAGVSNEAEVFRISAEMLTGAGGELLALGVTPGLPPLAIGDSVMFGARDALNAAGIEVDAAPARSGRQSMAAVQSHINRAGSRRAFIFQGIDWEFRRPEDLADLMAVLAEAPRVVILTHQLPSHDPWLRLEPTLNQTLREYASSYEQITLVDWHELSDGREDELTFDGAHLRPAGIELYVGAIVNALASPPTGLVADREQADGAEPSDAVAVVEVRTPPVVVVSEQPSIDVDAFVKALTAAREQARSSAEDVAGRTVDALIRWRASSPILPVGLDSTMFTAPAAPSIYEYIVVSGDSPSRIASELGVTVDQLVAWNGDWLLDRVYVGDILEIHCPTDDPCTLLELRLASPVCVDWTSPHGEGRACNSVRALVGLPARFTPETSPLAPESLWQWGDADYVRGEFVLDEVSVASVEPSRRTLWLTPSLAPLAIGDSVMVGARRSLERAGIRVNAEEGRIAQTARAELRHELAVNGIPDTVIFHAVGWDYLREGDFEELLRVARGVPHIIVITRQFPPRAPLDLLEREGNALLREYAPLYPHVTLIDWNAISDGREDELTWDGTHLTPKGAELFTNLIVSAIRQGPDGPPPPEWD